MARWVWGCVLTLTLALSACSSSEPAETTTTAPPRVTTTAPRPTESTLPGGFVDEAEARAVVYEFDAASGDVGRLAAALALAERSANMAPALPRILDEGGDRVADAVFDHLSLGSIWNVATLVAMQDYGRPSGSLGAPAFWSSEEKARIAAALEQSAGSVYGDRAGRGVAITRAMVRYEVEVGCSLILCDWDFSWYAVPKAVSLLNAGGVFVSDEVTIVFESGDSQPTPASAVPLESGVWMVTAGYFVDEPVVEFAPGLDGLITVAPTVTLSGWADDGTTIRYAQLEVGASGEVGNRWALEDVPLEPGTNGVVLRVGDVEGTEEERALTVTSFPDADEVFFYLERVDLGAGNISIAVDPAVLLVGEEARAAAIEAGELDEGDEFPQGYFVDNPSEESLVYPLADDVRIRMYDATLEGDLPTIAVPVNEFVRIHVSGDLDAYLNPFEGPWWGIVVDGEIVQLLPQYLP